MRAIAVASICVALYLTGCASMSKDECRVVDWRTVGYEDGVAGRASDSIGRYRKACASAGVTPDLNAYRAGRAEGLREYCQPQNGFRTGAHGADYAGFCPADLAPAFTRAYESGLELHARKHRLNEAMAKLASTRSEIDSIEHQMVSNGSAVLAKDNSSEATCAGAARDYAAGRTTSASAGLTPPTRAGQVALRARPRRVRDAARIVALRAHLAAPTVAIPVTIPGLQTAGWNRSSPIPLSAIQKYPAVLLRSLCP